MSDSNKAQSSGNATRTEPAPAKINLFLHVGDRRADGFHDLQSLVVFAAAGDVLSIAPADELSLAIDGPFAGALSPGDDNLVLRAARALAAQGNVKAGAAITLTKNLPVASGIGGGSSDAAASLRGLARLWNLEGLVLDGIAVGIGSDVPVCLKARNSWMEGRGEIVTPAGSMPRLALLLVNPGVVVSTHNVFAGLDPRSGTAGPCAERFEDTADLLRFLETTANDLEAPARALCPAIGETLAALNRLPGSLFTRMSGSGATCFAIFPDDGASARAAELLRKERPGWWVMPTFVSGQNIEHEETGQDIGPTDRSL